MFKSSRRHRSETESYPIDIVMPWVDGSDPAWLEERAKYSPVSTDDAREIRYRDMGLLRYWFRGVETFAPWVNKVYFITWGHVPEWLNTENEKLVVVNHRDYIPEKYLPTFSSHVIELNMHRIEGLSEHFVYFNDDVFLIAPTSREDFFVDGLPCDCLVESAITPRIGEFSSILCETVGVINRHFRKKDIRKQRFTRFLNPIYRELNVRSISVQPYHYIMGFYNHHIQQSHLRSTLSTVWEEEFEELDRTCSNRFRGMNDVNQYVFRYWNLCSGRFYPQYPIGKMLAITHDNSEIVTGIREGRYKTICINDAQDTGDYDSIMGRIASAFEDRLPNTSEFERC